jgi:hypothetical protein
MEILLQRKRKVVSRINERPYNQHEEMQGDDNLKINM